MSENTGVQIYYPPGYDKDLKIVDQPDTVWNEVAKFYAKYHIGIEMRWFIYPIDENAQPIIGDRKAGIFVVDKIVDPLDDKIITGAEKRRLKNQNFNVVDLIGHIFDQDYIEKNVRMSFERETLTWRASKPIPPKKVPRIDLMTKTPVLDASGNPVMTTDPKDPAVMFKIFPEVLPGNLKLLTNLNIDDAHSGKIPIPVFAEWDRPDAEKNTNGRIWVIQIPFAGQFVKVEEKVLQTIDKSNLPQN